jgi:uncharacterized phage protein (TIGR01671 family)
MTNIRLRAKNIETNEWWYAISTYPDNMFAFWEYIKDKVLDLKTLGLSINQNDKNKNEIFEGDIVKWIGRRPFSNVTSIGVVEYKVSDWSSEFYIRDITPEERSRFYDEMGANFRFNELEIIGNIYENPELLK